MMFLRWRWLLGLFACLFLGMVSVLADPADKPIRPTATDNAWVIFASGGCEGCEWLQATWFPTLKGMNSAPLPQLLFVDLDKEGGYGALM